MSNFNNQQPGQFVQQQPMSTNNMQQGFQQPQQDVPSTLSGKVVALIPVKNYQFNGKTYYEFQLQIDSFPQPITISAQEQSGPKKAQPGMDVHLKEVQQNQYGIKAKLDYDKMGGGNFKGGSKGGGNYLSIAEQLQKEKEIRKSGCNNVAIELLKLSGTKEKDVNVLLKQTLELSDALYVHIAKRDEPQQQPLAPQPNSMAGLQSDQNIG